MQSRFDQIQARFADGAKFIALRSLDHENANTAVADCLRITADEDVRRGGGEIDALAPFTQGVLRNLIKLRLSAVN